MQRFLAQGYGKLYMLLYMPAYSWFLFGLNLFFGFFFPSQVLNVSTQIATLNSTFQVGVWSLKSSMYQNVPSTTTATGSKISWRRSEERQLVT